MQPTSWPRIEEPFHRTLARNAAIAIVVAGIVALVRHDLRAFLPVAALALWPSLGGHYVELAFVNQMRTRISRGWFIQTVARVVVWFAGGVLLYLCMVVTAYIFPIKPLPLRLWWCGGFLFIGVELVVHAFLTFRGEASVYDGHG
jgi:hypothetical protein